MQPLVVFAHGQESGPWGSKIRFLADIAHRHGMKVVSPDDSSIPAAEARVQHLLRLPEIRSTDAQRLILVGSSMGGYVACVASHTIKPLGLFLLAPAFGIAGYEIQHPVSGASHTEIVMGWRDAIIPPANVIAFAAKHRAGLHLLDADHRLLSVLPEVGDLFASFLRRCFKPGARDSG